MIKTGCGVAILVMVSCTAGATGLRPGVAPPTLPPVAPPAIAPPVVSYGYQPYDSSNPRGFYHPNGMGYGRYHNSSKPHYHRSGPFSYRHFKGY